MVKIKLDLEIEELIKNSEKLTYNDYIKSQENEGWKRNHKIITEKNSEFVELFNLKKATTGTVIKVKLPENHIISVRGYKDNDRNNYENAYKLKLNLFDINNKELNQFTSLQITNETSVTGLYQLERIFYSDIRTDKFRFKNSFTISEIENDRESLFVSVISEKLIGGLNLPDININKNNTKFEFEFDLWNQ